MQFFEVDLASADVVNKLTVEVVGLDQFTGALVAGGFDSGVTELAIYGLHSGFLGPGCSGPRRELGALRTHGNRLLAAMHRLRFPLTTLTKGWFTWPPVSWPRSTG
jgi:hypothetical protein